MPFQQCKHWKSKLVNKNFQTWLLIGWRLCCQPISSHVGKSLSTNMLWFFSVTQAPVHCVPNLLVMADLGSIYSIRPGPGGSNSPLDFCLLSCAMQYNMSRNMCAVVLCGVLLSLYIQLSRVYVMNSAIFFNVSPRESPVPLVHTSSPFY